MKIDDNIGKWLIRKSMSTNREFYIFLVYLKETKNDSMLNARYFSCNKRLKPLLVTYYNLFVPEYSFHNISILHNKKLSSILSRKAIKALFNG